jgi:Flp pilus assembly protein TadD
MSDGTRDWEVEFPDVATGYEVRIPLRGTPGEAAPTLPARATAADRELYEEHAVEPAEAKPAAKAAAKPAPRASYLAGIAHVRELYRTRNYELALIECVELERQYPREEKLLAMKGSIYRKLGKAKLARETWERALALDPNDTIVADALRDLGAEAGAEAEEGGR